MPARKAKKKTRKAPSPAQLRARAKFVKMVRAKAKAAKSKKRVSKKAPAKRARNKTIITKSRKVVVLNGRKKTAKKPARKRNLDHRDAAHPIEVSRYWQGRKGYLTPWQRAHKAGQQGLFDHGIKSRNPKHKPLQVWLESRGTLHGYNRYIVKLKSADGREHEMYEGKDKKQAEWEARMLRLKIKNKEHGTAWIFNKTSNPATKKASPAVRSIRKSFTGLSANKTTAMHVPTGTPKNLAKLGRLVSVKTEKGVIKPAKGVTLVLCSDARGKLHIASTKQPAARNPQNKQVFGQVKEIEYETAKPHLGYKKSTIFFHKMGEAGGRKPVLFSDGQYLRLRGGSYKITPRGIVN